MNNNQRDMDPVKGMCLFNYNNLSSQNDDNTNMQQGLSSQDNTSVIQRSLRDTIAERCTDIWQPPVD